MVPETTSEDDISPAGSRRRVFLSRGTVKSGIVPDEASGYDPDRPVFHALPSLPPLETAPHVAVLQAGLFISRSAFALFCVVTRSPDQARRGSEIPAPESRFSAAISNASIATCHAVVSCSDLGSVKIYCLASSSVRSVLPSGKTTGRSKR